jgi:HK97 family phage portal protein
LWPFNRKPPVETKSLAQPTAELLELFGVNSVAGVTISNEQALRVPAVAAAVRVISEAVASLDRTVKRMVDGQEVDAPDHPAAKLLNGAVNPWTSGYELVRDLVAQALTSDAGGLAWVNRISNEPREIIHYQPGIISVTIEDTGEPKYRLSGQPVDAGNVLHLRGLYGRSPLSLARTAIALAAALESHGANLFTNGARPGGILETPKPVGDTGVTKMLAGWRAAHEGAEKAGRTAILWDGTTFKPLGLASTDAQYLENRTFQVLEVARAFGIPPGMLYELSRNTWSNSEQQAKEFITYTLTPWVRALEAALNRALLTDEERGEYRIALDIDDTSQADLTARATAISTLITARVLNPNEARDWLGMQPRPGGDEYANPAITPGPAAPANDNNEPQREAA